MAIFIPFLLNMEDFSPPSPFTKGFFLVSESRKEWDEGIGFFDGERLSTNNCLFKLTKPNLVGTNQEDLLECRTV